MSDEIDRSNRTSTETFGGPRVSAVASRKRWDAPKVISSELAFTAGGSRKNPETGTGTLVLRGIRPVS
jgi:hypothetical protein